MEYLSPNELIGVSATSQFFYQITNEPLLWKEHCYKKWNGKQNLPILLSLNENIRNWKRRYYDSLRDSKRELITEDDVLYGGVGVSVKRRIFSEFQVI